VEFETAWNYLDANWPEFTRVSRVASIGRTPKGGTPTPRHQYCAINSLAQAGWRTSTAGGSNSSM
jgi:hypothetical protein